MIDKCYVIAEAGLNHNGSVEIAKKLIDLASLAGADAVKFQKRSVDSLAVKEVLDASDDRFPEFGSTYREIREYLEFDGEQYAELFEYSASKQIEFLATAFDEEAVDFLLDLGVKKLKLASHSLTNYPLLEYIASNKVSTILSTGMADLDEIDEAVKIFRDNSTDLSLMHCVSSYPTPDDECNIDMVDVLRKRYGLRTGYSGHEMGYLPTLTAVARGAELIERHYTLDSTMVGFDHKISLEPDELINMIRQIRSIRKIIGSGEKVVSENEWITRRKYHVSIASKVAIKSGMILSENLITYRNPGTGIPAKHLNTVLGKKAKCDIDADVLLTTEMFE